jgi:hypothetical protein
MLAGKMCVLCLAWRGGRVAEGGGLLNRYTDNTVSRVRIPPSPPGKYVENNTTRSCREPLPCAVTCEVAVRDEDAVVAQLDRATGYELVGWGFESLRPQIHPKRPVQTCECAGLFLSVCREAE